jgi:hypothetical protein
MLSPSSALLHGITTQTTLKSHNAKHRTMKNKLQQLCEKLHDISRNVHFVVVFVVTPTTFWYITLKHTPKVNYCRNESSDPVVDTRGFILAEPGSNL